MYPNPAESYPLWNQIAPNERDVPPLLLDSDLRHHRRDEQHDCFRRKGQRPGDPGDGDERDNWCWWSDGATGDTLFHSLFPINPFKKVAPTVGVEGITTWLPSALSYHPGGANFGFADGSVRFLKDSISCWQYNPATGYPVGVTEVNGVFTLAAGSEPGR